MLINEKLGDDSQVDPPRKRWVKSASDLLN